MRHSCPSQFVPPARGVHPILCIQPSPPRGACVLPATPAKLLAAACPPRRLPCCRINGVHIMKPTPGPANLREQTASARNRRWYSAGTSTSTRNPHLLLKQMQRPDACSSCSCGSRCKHRPPGLVRQGIPSPSQLQLHGSKCCAVKQHAGVQGSSQSHRPWMPAKGHAIQPQPWQPG